MILYYINQFKSGLKVLLDKQPCEIENVEFVKPGKGQVFSRVKLRKLLTGQLIEKTFRSTDYLCSTDIIDVKMMYLYCDFQFWYFMKRDTFEQFELNKYVIQNKNKWLIEHKDYNVTLWNDQPISISVGKFVDLKVISNISNLKCNFIMSDARFKLCKLNTGVVMKVPLFIKIGDIIKINTITGKYHSRINK
ncbi:elongation factor P [Buchnera aphidicola]|uniref:elongation factor P n=1 Tax=Buchnera aphidicola TaxID=9 RepID=UPI00346405F7